MSARRAREERGHVVGQLIASTSDHVYIVVADFDLDFLKVQYQDNQKCGGTLLPLGTEQHCFGVIK